MNGHPTEPREHVCPGYGRSGFKSLPTAPYIVPHIFTSGRRFANQNTNFNEN
jgi:hypothetical protein